MTAHVFQSQTQPPPVAQAPDGQTSQAQHVAVSNNSANTNNLDYGNMMNHLLYDQNHIPAPIPPHGQQQPYSQSQQQQDHQQQQQTTPQPEAGTLLGTQPNLALSFGVPPQATPAHPTQTTPTHILYEQARLAATARSSPNARRAGLPSQRRPWSTEEEHALMAGLDRVKGPHWSQILAMFGAGGTVSEVLKDRNQVQLKDKARNLKLFFLKSGIEVPYYLQFVTGELKTRAPSQVAKNERRKAAEEMAKDDAAHIAAVNILGNGMASNSNLDEDDNGNSDGNIETIETIENIENIDSMESIDNIENIDNIGNIDSVVSIGNIGNIENIENTGNIDTIDIIGNNNNNIDAINTINNIENLDNIPMEVENPVDNSNTADIQDNQPQDIPTEAAPEVLVS